MAFSLITGVIVLAIGIVLWIASRAFPNPTAHTIVYYLGLILIIVGAIIIVYAAIVWGFAAAVVLGGIPPPISLPL